MKRFQIIFLSAFALIVFENCRSKTHRSDQTSAVKKDKSQISIGYDSLKIFLGSKGNYVVKMLSLKRDKDNDYGGNTFGYYKPLQVIYVDKMAVCLDLYFDFNTVDSSLMSFKASLTFCRSERVNVLPVLRKIMSKKLSKTGSFSDQEILSGVEQCRKYAGYLIKVKLDTNLYAPTFHYKIESTK